MTPDEIAAALKAELEAALEARIQQLQQQIDRLSKRVDAIGDYAGKTYYLATQTKLSTDRRLAHLEDNDTVDN